MNIFKITSKYSGTDILILLAWLLPLLFGLLIFILWIIFQVNMLEEIAILNIFFGIGFGIFGILLSLILIFRNKPVNTKKYFRLIALIFVNVPVALCLLYISFLIKTVYVVRISNNCSFQVQDVLINTGGQKFEIKKIESRDTVQKNFWIENDGTIMISYTINQMKKLIITEEYITRHHGGKMNVEINENSNSFSSE